jgi:phage terminase large subunit
MIGTQPRKINNLAPYAPLNWQLAPLRDKSLVMLLSGGSGGGKSRCAAEKMHAYLLKYPGAVGLAVRKTRKAANLSCVPTLWKVMGGIRSGVEWNKSDNIFTYPNGSVLYTGGLQDEEQRESLRSIGGEGGVDVIWVEEANKLTEKDYNELLARLRHTAADWRQIILTTNPDAPSHWINQRLIIGGEASVYYSVASDNPHLPESYFETLKTLTGTQYQRLVLNRWVQAEGVVYDNFSVDGNVTDEAEYQPNLPVVWGVDDGYAAGAGKGTESYHPRTFLLGQWTGQGGLNIFAEYYRCLEVEETSLHNVLAMPYPSPSVAYVDSSAAQLKGRMMTMGIMAFGATHVVTEGVKKLRGMICDGNGVRLIKIHPRCKELIGEMQSYAYSESAQSVNGERKPAKVNDHGPDGLRYLAFTGPIESSLPSWMKNYRGGGR